MIYLYSGVPGSGKSLHAAKDIIDNLNAGRTIFVNYTVNLNNKRLKNMTGDCYYIPDRKIGTEYEKEIIAMSIKNKFQYIPKSFLTPEFFYEWAKKNHKKGKENQSIIIIDESQRFFNPRDFSRQDRRKWIDFFIIHRHLGYKIILISPNDRLIDRQIRYTIDYEVKHRNVSRFGYVGMMLKIFHLKLFVGIYNWYGGTGTKDFSSFFWYHNYLGQLYDSYALFDSADPDEASDASRKDGGTGVPVEHEAPEASVERKYQIMRIVSILSQLSKTPDLYHGGNTRQEKKSIELN
jgi:zona occludens toxin